MEASQDRLTPVPTWATWYELHSGLQVAATYSGFGGA